MQSERNESVNCSLKHAVRVSNYKMQNGKCKIENYGMGYRPYFKSFPKAGPAGPFRSATGRSPALGAEIIQQFSIFNFQLSIAPSAPQTTIYRTNNKRDCLCSPFIHLFQAGAFVVIPGVGEQIPETEIQNIGRAAPLLQGFDGEESL